MKQYSYTLLTLLFAVLLMFVVSSCNKKERQRSDGPEAETEVNQDTSNRTSVSKIEFFVKGMTCSGCEEHVKHAVSELEGITEVSVSYEEGKAVVSYDKSKTTPEKIKTAINSTGYKIVDDK